MGRFMPECNRFFYYTEKTGKPLLSSFKTFNNSLSRNRNFRSRIFGFWWTVRPPTLSERLLNSGASCALAIAAGFTEYSLRLTTPDEFLPVQCSA